MKYHLMRVLGATFSAYWLLCFAVGIVTRGAPSQIQQTLPRIETKGSEEMLILPPLLKDAIRREAAGFRLPQPTDRTENWKNDTDAGNLPWAVWGDFDGGGRTDVALILLGNREWKLTIFHQTDAGFRLVYSDGSKTDGPDAVVASPQKLWLQLVPKGKPYVSVTVDTSGRHETKHSFPNDTIEFSALEQFLVVLYWKDGKYQQMDFSGE